MIAPFRFAFGSARVRAMKARLLGPAEGAALAATKDVASLASLVDPGAPPNPREIERRAFTRLVDVYVKLAASFPQGRDLLAALWRRHEVENLKLVWRAKASAPAHDWASRWRHLGHLATLDLEVCESAGSLEELAPHLLRTPYSEIFSSTLRAHAGDAAAGEMAFDRWTATRLLHEARRLPRRESLAKELVFAWIRERDVDLLARRRALGFSAEAALASLVLLRQEERREELARLAAWPSGSEPLSQALPRGLARTAPRARDWNDLGVALARRRRSLCWKAFLSNPFRLAPAVALVFLLEAEARAIGAIAESRGRPEVDAPLARALAPSLLEA